MAPSAAFFSDASHFTIQGSQFTATQTTSIQSLAVDPALEILHKHQALEATHTSKTAANAAKCKPGTRAEAIKDITRWAAARQIEAARQAEDDRRVDAACQVEADLQVEVEPSSKSSVESVLWLRGPAGAGKTCIMREVARICRQEGVLAGDYFFSTRVPGLDDEAPFVATIVSHLITVIPALDNPIRETIRCNPTIFKQALDLQVEELISNHTAIIPPQTPRILVVDGFDECRDQSQRKHLLDLLHSLVTPPHFFRVVMASRPEYDIRTAFDQPPLESMTKILHLEKYEASGEIYEFLSEGFARIRKTHPARESIPAEWPGQATLHALTDKSSGIFAYPSTVIKYIDNPRHHPVDLLDHVLKPPPAVSSGHPFTELDALYEIILNPPDTDIPRMKRILHLIMMIPRLLGTVPAGSSPSHRSKFSFMPDFIDPYQMTNTLLSAPQLDGFLSLRRGTTEMTLCDLHSVLSVTEPIPPSPCFHNEGYETMYSPGRGPWIYFHHKTLEDYLCSPQRAGNLYQAQDDTCSDILAVCVHNMELWDRESRSGYVDYRKKIVKITLIFSCVFWAEFVLIHHFLPPAVQDFDARIAWRFFAFAKMSPPPMKTSFNNLVIKFHKAMCKEGEECQRSCAAFRRMLGYLGPLQRVIVETTRTSPMDRLREFEEASEGLFSPLDLSPATVVIASHPLEPERLRLVVLTAPKSTWHHREPSLKFSPANIVTPVGPTTSSLTLSEPISNSKDGMNLPQGDSVAILQPSHDALDDASQSPSPSILSESGSGKVGVHPIPASTPTAKESACYPGGPGPDLDSIPSSSEGSWYLVIFVLLIWVALCLG